MGAGPGEIVAEMGHGELADEEVEQGQFQQQTADSIEFTA